MIPCVLSCVMRYIQQSYVHPQKRIKEDEFL